MSITVDTYGSFVDTDSNRWQRNRQRFGEEIAKKLEAPIDEDFEDLQRFLGPTFCPDCN